ncbi:MAG: 5-methyltetrahydropteroyltriglutamate--homocysteine S-methyltransferase [Clostridium sp.]|nr:5-methyltetrahydropteroyltriglutamate--homocysteine S-methyltransferase [Clostridium sp.]
MKTGVIGYPRVGELRELKFITEKYFRKEVSLEELQKTAKEIREKQWKLQKENGIDFISSNDFSFYDGVLDTAFLINAVSDEYKDLSLSKIDTYFVAARGYQGNEGDVKALSMRKWFNTNYHYMVPVLDDNTILKLNDDKIFNEFNEALALGIKTKAVLVGPFTFLKLAKYNGKKNLFDFKEDIVNVYKDILEKFNEINGEWIQFDEPSLVTDLEESEINLFVSIYEELLKSKKDLKILLQTYFGDVRDGYKKITSLDFDGIGLDFLEGKETLKLIKKNGFPKEKLLFAGVVNGKNIWRNDYKKTLNILDELKSFVEPENIVINTSCSLLHVPYTLENETKLDENYKKHFSFAKEKLNELNELKKITEGKGKDLLENNIKLFEERLGEKSDVLNKIDEKLFTRLPERKVRKNIQKKFLNLPLLPTTTIGSFPQTKEIKLLRKSYRNNEISEEEYNNKIKEKIAEVIKLQEEIGIDVLVHGEYERNDMVEYFGENLEGYLFTEKAWVQSYGTRCVKPPVIWSTIKRKNPITVEYSSFAQSLTDKPVKGMLTGPVTILNWSFPREDVSLEEMAYEIALAIREEVLDLESFGINVIQIDEAALKEKLPLRKEDWYKEYLDWAIKAFNLVHSGVKETTQIHTHMCYSEFENIIKDIDNMDADVISFEASRSNLSIIDALNKNNFETEVGPGVYDIHSPRVPSVEEIVEALNKMLKKIPKEKLWVNPDCGLKTRGEKETNASLKNMVEATKIVRKQIQQ